MVATKNGSLESSKEKQNASVSTLAVLILNAVAIGLLIGLIFHLAHIDEIRLVPFVVLMLLANVFCLIMNAVRVAEVLETGKQEKKK